MRDYLNFERLIVPLIVRSLHWLLLAAATVVIIVGVYHNGADEILNFVGAAFLFLAVGYVVMRLILEWPMLVFRISETVSDIKTESSRRLGAAFSTGVHGGPLEVSDFLSFRRMIMPYLVRALFWLSIAIAVLAVPVGAYVAYNSGVDGQEVVATALGFGAGGAGAVFVLRILAEIIIILFKINEDFSDIKDLTVAASSNTSRTSNYKPTFQDLLAFRRMITPVWLKVWFWIYIAIVFLVAVVGYWTFLADAVSNPMTRLLLAAGLIAIGTLIVRIITEFSLVPFSINETVSDVRDLIAVRVRRIAGSDPSTLLDFLAFRMMIAPYLIQTLYWVFTLGTLLLAAMFADVVLDEVGSAIQPPAWGVLESGDFGVVTFDWSSPAGFAVGLALLIPLAILLLIIRIYAEQFIVAFKISEDLTDIRFFAEQQVGAVGPKQPFHFGTYLADLLAYRRMITPILVQLAYWFYTAIVVLFGVGHIDLHR